MCFADLAGAVEHVAEQHVGEGREATVRSRELNRGWYFAGRGRRESLPPNATGIHCGWTERFAVKRGGNLDASVAETPHHGGLRRSLQHHGVTEGVG